MRACVREKEGKRERRKERKKERGKEKEGRKEGRKKERKKERKNYVRNQKLRVIDSVSQAEEVPVQSDRATILLRRL